VFAKPPNAGYKLVGAIHTGHPAVEPSFLNHQERKSSRKSKFLIKADPLGCDAPNNGFCRPYPSLTADDISPFLDAFAVRPKTST
jgi:hypothetical protein